MGMSKNRVPFAHSLYGGIRDEELTYEQHCELWAQQLPPEIVRSLAYDYRHGARDEASVDGMKEFQRRWPSRAKVIETRDSQSDGVDEYDPWGARCIKHKQGRRPAYCGDCAQIQQLLRESSNDEPTHSIDQASQAIMDEPEELLGAQFDLIEQLDHPMIAG